MFLMYKLFRNKPTQSSLEPIINNAKRMVSYASPNTKCIGISTEDALSLSNGWLQSIYEPSQTYKDFIDTNFNEILSLVDFISKHGCTEEARTIILNVIQEYASKIKQLYELNKK